MKEYTIVLTSEITMIAKMPEGCRIKPTDFPKEKYEQAIKDGKLEVKDFDDFKVTKMQVFDTSRKSCWEKMADACIEEMRKATEPDDESIGLTD